MVADRDALHAAAFARLAAFLDDARLTSVVSQLEYDLLGRGGQAAVESVQAAGLGSSLLSAALVTRQRLGRLNDLIHAAAIGLALPKILAPGEQITTRPSLAAGNDPSRRFDLETDQRVAEFKLAVWTGTDAMRKRGVFHDLVHLAAEPRTRAAELYVVGPKPSQFLRGSKSTARWALTRGSATTQDLFRRRFGNDSITVRDFTQTLAGHVNIVDLATVLPEIAALLTQDVSR